MSTPSPVKTMRLRYDGTCAGCGGTVSAGETAHYLRAVKTVRCLSCGPEAEAAAQAGAAPQPVETPLPGHSPSTEDATVELVQGELPRSGACDDCGRRLRRGSDALFAPTGRAMLCLECVTLDTVHSLGVAGGGARREHDTRRQRHHTRVRTAHPRLGGLILALRDDPAHVRAWQTGAVGEEDFGRCLSGIAGDHLKVLHDRKLPRSAANIDHLAVTGQGVWVLDAKRYKGGRVETRGQGVFSRRSPDLFVGGRNQMKFVEGVHRQVEVVRQVLAPFAAEHGLAELPVRGALVFINAEFGLFPSPFAVDGVWVGWGKAIRKRLASQGSGALPVADIAKLLARHLRAG
ncbi:MAG TPA: NERD domain-containing protein [Egibacteraceae bacterium]|nr:NERD domain-containing protein [Egibacteraceae bacterium]